MVVGDEGAGGRTPSAGTTRRSAPRTGCIRLGVDVRSVDAEDADTIAGYLTKDELSGAALEVARPEGEGRAGRVAGTV